LQFAFFKESFWDFWGFLKISCLVAKSEIGTLFCKTFDTYVDPWSAFI
jgi:hypothetical protein